MKRHLPLASTFTRRMPCPGMRTLWMPFLRCRVIYSPLSFACFQSASTGPSSGCTSGHMKVQSLPTALLVVSSQCLCSHL